MDILIKNMELPPEGKQICLWVMHNGTVWHEVARDMIPTKMEAVPVLHCKDCENFNKETDICTLWGSWTNEDGFCHKAFAVLERTT